MGMYVHIYMGTYNCVVMDIPYVTKCSRSIIFANIIIRELYVRTYMVYIYIYLCTHYYNYGGVTLR